MKRTDNKFAIELESEKSVNFKTDIEAIMACNMMALHFANEGFLTTTHLCKENGTYELCVHFDLRHTPTLPQGYLYSSYNITSHEYNSYGETKRVRCKTFSFRVNR